MPNLETASLTIMNVFLLLHVPFLKRVVFHISRPPSHPSHMHCFLGLSYRILNTQSTIKNSDEYLLTSFNQTVPSFQTDFSSLKGTKHGEEQPFLPDYPFLYFAVSHDRQHLTLFLNHVHYQTHISINKIPQ